jgi:hypothetical protein
MTVKSIKIKNFLSKKKPLIKKEKISNLFKDLINSDNHILSSMDKSYIDSYTKTIISSSMNLGNVDRYRRVSSWS